MVDTRCTSGGIEHSFVNYLVYTNKLRSLGCGIRIYPHAEGTVNSLGGLRPDTVVANITGTLLPLFVLFSMLVFIFCMLLSLAVCSAMARFS